MENNSNNDTGDVIRVANSIIEKLNISPDIVTISQCGHLFFVQVYESILGEKPPGLNSSPESIEDQIHNVQVVVDSLATDVLGMDLSHIDVQGIVQQDRVQVKNLLEVFDGLLDCLLEELDEEHINNEHEMSQSEKQTQKDILQLPSSRKNDYYISSEDHETLSDTVFQEDAEETKKPLSKQVSSLKAFVKETSSACSFGNSYSWLKNGESTNELINENSQEQHIIDESHKKSTENYGGDQKASSSTQWSSILNKTSACESVSSEIKEIGIRPRKPLGVEKKKLHKEKNNVQLHSHTHHHYHHKANNSFDSYSSSSISTVGLKPCETYEMSLDSLIQENEYDDTLSSDLQTFNKTSTNQKVSKKIQTSSSILVDSAVQTEPRVAHSNLQKNITLSDNLHLLLDADTNIRLKSLSEVHDRLKKLRNHFPQHSEDRLHFKDKNNQPAERKSNLKSVNQKKESSKVSFAFKAHHPCASLSDTEIRYSPTQNVKVRKVKIKDPLKEKIEERLQKKKYFFEKNAIPSITSGEETPENIYDSFFKREKVFQNIPNKYIEEKENQTNQHEHLLKSIHKQTNHQLTKKRKKGEEVAETTTKQTKHASTRNKFAYRLANVYAHQPVSKTKSRKRSASASPVRQRKLKDSLILPETEILPIMEEEFPFLPLSPHAVKLMWRKQMLQLSNNCKINKDYKNTKMQKSIEEAQCKQEALSKLLRKETEQKKRLREHKEMQEKELQVRRKLQDRRQSSARARRYYDEYVVMNRARMLKRDIKEEKMFKDLFQDGLDLQKQRIQEMRKYAKEIKEKKEIKQRNEIESLENYYRDQFSMLAETISKENDELEVRQKAQINVLRRMRTEMRKRMERELKVVQSQLTNDDDAIFFRQLDADNLRKQFQLSMYKGGVM